MSFNANSSDEKVVKEAKLYTGLANMRVVAINPNKAVLEQMGYKPQQEPVYTSTDDKGVQKLRMDFYLSGAGLDPDTQIRTKIAFFLENQDRVNQAGTKGEWINNFGRTAWGTPDAPPSTFKWFDSSTARKAKVGEADLTNFLINWLNISPQDEAKLDNFEVLFAGDYSELLSILNANPNNEVRVLLAVREGKYQSVYNRYFDRATNKRTNYWESHIKSQTEAGYPPKEDFGNSFTFKEWEEPTVMQDAPPNTDGSQQTEDDPF